jgi:hypothetical protein
LSSEKDTSLDQPSKRFFSETSHEFKRKVTHDRIPPKRLYSSPDRNKHKNCEEMASVGSEKVHRFAEANTSPHCLKIPILPEHVPRILGTKGHTIMNIQSKTGCIIDIRGKGAQRGTSNEPLHAKVTGDTPSAIEAAAARIRLIISGCEMSDHVDVFTKNVSTEHSVAPTDQKYAYYEVNERTKSDTKPNNLYCRLNFPPWLVYDNFTKDRLHCKSLLQSSSVFDALCKS